MSVSTKEREMQEHLEKREYWWWAEQARSPRIDYLRKAVWFKGTKASAYIPGLKIDTTGLRIYTEVFQRAEAFNEPRMLTFAKAYSKLLDEMPIFVVDHSRILGYVGSAPHMVLWYVSKSYHINQDLFNDRSGLIPDEDRPWIKEIMDWWKPRTYQTAAERVITRTEKMETAMAISHYGNSHLDAHENPGLQYDWLLKGFNHIIGVINENIAQATKKLTEGPLNAPEDLPLLDKIDNWNAMKMVLEASIRYARRYARLTKIIAENFETDPQRKQELLKMSEMCNHILANPPESFWESLQHDHFCQVLKRLECGDTAWTSRPDYYYYPYYKKDVIDEKNITREDALELIGEHQMRCFETSRAWSRNYREIITGSPGPYAQTIGGVDPETGEDACNELTDAILESARMVRCGDPTYGLRYHKKMRPETMRQAYECIRHGLGYPSFRNDPVCIQNIMHNFNIPLKEARTWAHQACMSPCGLTKWSVQPLRYAGAMVNGSKALELALNNGICMVSGLKHGPATGDPTKFETFEQLYEAWLKQEAHIYWMASRVREKCRWVGMTYHPRPWLSASFERCVEAGDNSDRVKERGNAWVTSMAWMDQMDGMAAVKKLVFDEKKYTMAQLVEALRKNWEGYEDMRMDFVRVPKWGNDDDYVDDMVFKMHKDVQEQVLDKTIEWNGTKWMHLPENVAAYVVAGSKIGALPNGRRLGDTCYDGGCSPGAGLDKKGPTAVLRSVSKINHVQHFKASLLNQRLNPTQMVGEKGFELFNNYINSWFDLGINHVQFNLIDNETLFAAQKEPEKYPELIVRVAGYSAHFVELNKKAQDTIIARNVQTL